jgi:D-glycero-D-manno-heptose 1,7-bisphosphate phosphatase
MIDQAARERGLDAARSFMVGDKWLDIQAGRGAGTRTVLVRTGLGADEERHPAAGVTADAVVDNLAAAVSWILAKLKT